MNSSLALIQKIKNIAFAGTGSFDDYAINFPLLAFPLSEDDFVFLQDKPLNSTGEDALAYWRSKYQFALLSNSIPTHPFVWSCDPDNLLYDNYKKVLNQASLIAPGQLSAEEQKAFQNASQLLFSANGDDTSVYTNYKKYRDENNSLRNEITNASLQLNNLPQTNSTEYRTLTDKLNQLQQSLEDSSLKWITVGQKLEVENALNVLRSIRVKDDFVTKWQTTKNFMNSDSNGATDPDSKAVFFETSCTPNDFLVPNSKSWQKFTLNKDEIANLINQYQKEVSNDITTQFGETDVKLESISFELCMLSVIRSWFTPDLLSSNLWKLPDGSPALSSGKNDFAGSIPCYPVKIIIIKNASFNLSEDKANDALKEKIKTGNPVFFGNLLMKPLPATTLRPQTLTGNQLRNFALINKQGLRSALSIQGNVKLRSFQALNVSAAKEITSQAVGSGTTAGKTSPGATSTATPGEISRFIRTPLHVVIPIKFPTTPQKPADPKFNFSGKITDVSNNGLAGVEISVQRLSDGALQSAVSDNAGNYSVVNLLAGNYHIRFSKQGYKSKEIDVTINNNNVTNVLLEAEKIKEEYFLVAVISKKFPQLPNPIPGAKYT